MKLIMNKAIQFPHQNMSKNVFWKKHTNPVPGRVSRHTEIVSREQSKDTSITSFQSFQESVKDIWDINDKNDNCFYDDNEIDSIVDDTFKVFDKNTASNTSLACDQKTLSTSHKPNSQLSKVADVHHSKTHKALDNTRTKQENNEIHKINNSIALLSCSNEFTQKFDKFKTLLSVPIVNLDKLRRLSWSGIPKEVRPTVWRLLANCIPADSNKQQESLEEKHVEYWNLVANYYNSKKWDDGQNATYRQIHIDIPRTSQLIKLFQQRTVQEIYERILFLWAIRHPASGYVQGMNDLVTPFFVIFLQEHLKPTEDVTQFDVKSLTVEKRAAIEADSFWCLSKFLGTIQDNYTLDQLGIQQKVNRLKEHNQRIDGILHKHLQNNGIDYIQFSYRWMNNLLTRELPLQCTIRLWDTYLAESDLFPLLHDYICVAFLRYWREELLKEKDFQGLMLTLQNLPTTNWTTAEIEVVLAEAYKLKYSFADAPNHFLHVQ